MGEILCQVDAMKSPNYKIPKTKHLTGWSPYSSQHKSNSIHKDTKKVNESLEINDIHSIRRIISKSQNFHRKKNEKPLT